jgi:CBS domain-containing protein
MKEVLRAADLMTRPVRRVTSRMIVREAAGFLVRHGISGAPVEDGHGRWLGVFSMNDLARAVASRLSEPTKERTLEVRGPAEPASMSALPGLDALQVREVMTPGLVSVFPGATLAEVVHSMCSSGVHRVFVLEEEKATLEGVITTMDVVRWLDRCANGSVPSAGLHEIR